MYTCQDEPDLDPPPSPPRVSPSATQTEPLMVTFGRVMARVKKLELDFQYGFEDEAEKLGLFETSKRSSIRRRQLLLDL